MLLIADSTSTSMAMVAGLVVVIWLLMRRSDRYFGRRAGSDDFSPRRQRPAGKDHRPLSDVPPELVRWQVEMHETARDLKAELDSKIGALQQLNLLAREQVERLELAVARAGQIELALGAVPPQPLPSATSQRPSGERPPAVDVPADDSPPVPPVS